MTLKIGDTIADKFSTYKIVSDYGSFGIGGTEYVYLLDTTHDSSCLLMRFRVEKNRVDGAYTNEVTKEMLSILYSGEKDHCLDNICKGNGEPIWPKVEYQCGDRFTSRVCGTEYILSQVAPCTVALINLRDGNRWSEGQEVQNPWRLTEDDFKKICGSARDVNKFKKI